jgi:acetyl-CoA carboxylase carboxyl transferase subunit alpha
MKVVDDVVPEPAGGAHRDPPKAAENLGKALRKHLGELAELNPEELVKDRYDKFRALGVFSGR